MKDNRELIASLIFIVIGLFALFQDIRAGILLIVVGFGASSQVRKWILEGIKLVYSLTTKENTKKTNQTIKSSPKAIQQQADRDAIVGKIVSTGIQNITINQKSEDYDKKFALKVIYKNMITPLRLLNLAANIGLKNKEEYENISKAIDSFMTAKMENELELDNELKNKLNEVMGAFRFTSHELFLKLRENKFNEKLSGSNSFDFLTKCEDVTEEIRKRLK